MINSLHTRHLIQLLSWITTLDAGSGIAPTRLRLAQHWLDRFGPANDDQSVDWRFLLHYEALLDYGFVRESTSNRMALAADMAALRADDSSLQDPQETSVCGGMHQAIAALVSAEREDVRVSLTIDGHEFLQQESGDSLH